jgi:hypothetical protein
VRQGFVEHFQNLNPKPARTKNYRYNELEELYHEKVKISNRFRE